MIVFLHYNVETNQTLIGNGFQTLNDNWDTWGIKDWANRNINLKKWDRWRKDKLSLNNIFGRHKNSGPPANRSSYVNINAVNHPGGQLGMSNLNSGIWYEPSGQVNWAFATASTLGAIKGTLNSEQMYVEDIRRGLSGNYQLTGRNLSLFREAPMTKATIPISKVGQWAGWLGRNSFYLGLVMDGIGVRNYMGDPNSENAVHPAKAGLNTAMGAIGTFGGTLMAIPSTLYFSIDLFYPGKQGWIGLGIDQERLYRENKAINPNYQAFPGALKQ